MTECAVTQLNADELLAWQTSFCLASALKEGLRNQVVDMLTEEERQKLFEGYVLQEHYDSLMGKLFVKEAYAHDDYASY